VRLRRLWLPLSLTSRIFAHSGIEEGANTAVELGVQRVQVGDDQNGGWGRVALRANAAAALQPCSLSSSAAPPILFSPSTPPQTVLQDIERKVADFQRQQRARDQKAEDYHWQHQPVDLQIGSHLLEDVPRDLRSRLWYTLVTRPDLALTLQQQLWPSVPTAAAAAAAAPAAVDAGDPGHSTISHAALFEALHAVPWIEGDADGGGGLPDAIDQLGEYSRLIATPRGVAMQRCLGGVEPVDHVIERDLGRTFPEHPLFADGATQEGKGKLGRLLRAYALRDPEVGYCQGQGARVWGVFGCMLEGGCCNSADRVLLPLAWFGSSPI